MENAHNVLNFIPEITEKQLKNEAILQYPEEFDCVNNKIDAEIADCS